MFERMVQFSPLPLLCDGWYVHHYSYKAEELAHLPIAARLAAFATTLSLQTTGDLFWAWDSAPHRIHERMANLLPQLGFYVAQSPRMSADSLIASRLVQCKEGVVVSSDKDIQAFATERVSFLSHVTGWDKLHTAKEIAAKWEMDDPVQILDVLAWTGDDVDDIPGIPGVGLAAARKLARSYPIPQVLYGGEPIPAEWLPYEEYFEALLENYIRLSPNKGVQLPGEFHVCRSSRQIIAATLDGLDVPASLITDLLGV